jgi:putative hydrolase of the HAD superfamily
MKIISKNITTLFLDIGGVLLTSGWNRKSRQLAITRFQLDGEEQKKGITLSSICMKKES